MTEKMTGAINQSSRMALPEHLNLRRVRHRPAPSSHSKEGERGPYSRLVPSADSCTSVSPGLLNTPCKHPTSNARAMLPVAKYSQRTSLADLLVREDVAAETRNDRPHSGPDFEHPPALTKTIFQYSG
jgi:hypothetical protein